MKNQVIEVLNKEHGKKVVEYWKSKRVDTGNSIGVCTKGDGVAERYYGVIGGSFGCYSIEFVRKYNAEIIELPKEENTFPRVMLVSDNGDSWCKRVVLMKKCDRYISWINAETIEESEIIYKTAYWSYAKEISEKVELTKSEIAEKFGISIEQLVINDD